MENKIELHKEDQEIILAALTDYLKVINDEITTCRVQNARLALYKERAKTKALLAKLSPEE